MQTLMILSRKESKGSFYITIHDNIAGEAFFLSSYKMKNNVVLTINYKITFTFLPCAFGSRFIN